MYTKVNLKHPNRAGSACAKLKTDRQQLTELLRTLEGKLANTGGPDGPGTAREQIQQYISRTTQELEGNQFSLKQAGCLDIPTLPLQCKHTFSTSQGPITIFGQVCTKWVQLASQTIVGATSLQAYLGNPTENFKNDENLGIWVQIFERGMIINVIAYPAAYVVYGPIFSRYQELGALESNLGIPVGDTAQWHDKLYSNFENGIITFDPNSGVHELSGAILTEWSIAESRVGYPLSNATSTPDGIGQFIKCESGAVYWSPDVGAHFVSGPILQRWGELGFEQSNLGYPIIDEADWINPKTGQQGRISKFQFGQLGWTEKDGIVELGEELPVSAWKAIGPFSVTGILNFPPCAGRVDGIDISPDYDGAGHAAMFLAMPRDGGIWRSSNFTSDAPTWTPLTDHLPGISDARRIHLNDVSTLAVDPTNPRTVYARCGGSPPAILKSSDGGDGWTLLGEGQFVNARGIWRVLVDPVGNVYVAFDSGGFWRSIDRGETWSNLATTDLAGVAFRDAVYFADNDGKINIYVGIVDYQQQGRSGLWSYANNSWTQMPLILTNLLGQTFTIDAIKHITMSADHKAGACASLAQDDDSNAKVGLLNTFKLIQGTWYPQWYFRDDKDKNAWFITQGGYVQPICIAPDGRIYAGGIGLAQSAAGQNIVPISSDAKGNSIHHDVHVVVAYQEHIYVGTDGGIFRFAPRPNEPGVDVWESLNSSSLTNFLSTSASAHPIDSVTVLVGNQDNGIARLSPSGWSHSGYSNERERLRFDPDPVNQGRFAFSGDPYNGFYWSEDAGVRFKGFQPPGVPAPDPPPPFSLFWKNSARIMIGWTTVYETPDRGQTWNKLLTLETAPSAVAYGDDRRAYIGVGTQLLETLDYGHTWHSVNYDFRDTIISLCTDLVNPGAIYVATGRQISRRLSPDTSWETLTGNLSLPINVMALFPTSKGEDPWLFVGTDAGIFLASELYDARTLWMKFGTGLPDSSVLDLEITPSKRLLLAATWGRGAWTHLIGFGPY